MSAGLGPFYLKFTAEVRRGLNVHARTCAQVDKALFGRPLVVSSDSLVLDRCKSWINLAAACLERVPDPWIVDLFESES